LLAVILPIKKATKAFCSGNGEKTFLAFLFAFATGMNGEVNRAVAQRAKAG